MASNESTLFLLQSENRKCEGKDEAENKGRDEYKNLIPRKIIYGCVHLNTFTNVFLLLHGQLATVMLRALLIILIFLYTMNVELKLAHSLSIGNEKREKKRKHENT